MPGSLNFKSDRHCRTDELGFDLQVATIAEMLTAPDFETPFCLGIYGKWGSGKTSFMHLLEERLRQMAESKDAEGPLPVPVWFNPWRYEKEEHLIIPFLKTIQKAADDFGKQYEEKGVVDEVVTALGKAAKGIGRTAAAFAYGLTLECKLAGTGITLEGSKAAEREEELKRRDNEEEKSPAETLSSIYYDMIAELKSSVNDRLFRFVVFVDDLDRCLPEKVVELLESMKLFLDLEGYIFMLGVDHEVVEQGVRHHYHFYQLQEKKGEEGASRRLVRAEDYLDKMIQVPLLLPPIEPGCRLGYIEKLLKGSGYGEYAALVDAGIEANPRTLKRFANYLAYMGRLAERLKPNLMKDFANAAEQATRQELVDRYFTPPFYIKWAIIVFACRPEHERILDNWHYLIDLQDAVRQIDASDQAKKGPLVVPGRLRQVLAYGEPFPDDPWLVNSFIHLASAISFATDGATLAPEKAMRGRAFTIGDMVRVPRGEFLYGEMREKRTIDKDFEIDVYPVTNRQYREFIEAGGYQKDDYWSDVGRKWRDENLVTEPKYRRDAKWNSDEQPVVGVSWYEAEAYANWADKILPTEEQWEKAARGDRGRKYPWGDNFNGKKCNTKESRKGGTTPVTAYPEGASPYGCHDMAGNVWEWTSSWYDKDQHTKVLRGGSWFDGRSFARCAFRYRQYPVLRDDSVGFRCARAVK